MLSRKYKHILKFGVSPEGISAYNLHKSKNEIFKERFKKGLVTSPNHDEQGGIKSLRGDIGRCLNISIDGENLTKENLETGLKKLPEAKRELLLKHYSQDPSYIVGSDVFLSCYHPIDSPIKIPSESFSQAFDEENETELEQSSRIYFQDGEIYFSAVGVISANMFVPAPRRQSRSAEALFKLTENGFRLEKIGTNQSLFAHLYMGNVNEVKKLANVPKKEQVQSETHTPKPIIRRVEAEPKPMDFLQRIKKKWQAISPNARVAAGVTLLLGIGAIVAGALFCPLSLAVTLPYVGKLLVAPALIYGGAGLSGFTTIAHMTHTALKKIPFAAKEEIPSPRQPQLTKKSSSQADIGRRLESTQPSPKSSHTFVQREESLSRKRSSLIVHMPNSPSRDASVESVDEQPQRKLTMK